MWRAGVRPSATGAGTQCQGVQGLPAPGRGELHPSPGPHGRGRPTAGGFGRGQHRIGDAGRGGTRPVGHRAEQQRRDEGQPRHRRRGMAAP
uniref:Uncharacterized protein n=1 Tax=uncultured marine virus TaxID=186617 RepID=A0A0F7L5S1_9VIRU|nr:hypothetical protein [uncultured marine virus]